MFPPQDTLPPPTWSMSLFRSHPLSASTSRIFSLLSFSRVRGVYSSNIDKCERQIEKWTLVSVPTARHPPSPNLVDEPIQEPPIKCIYQSNLHSRVLVFYCWLLGRGGLFVSRFGCPCSKVGECNMEWGVTAERKADSPPLFYGSSH